MWIIRNEDAIYFMGKDDQKYQLSDRVVSYLSVIESPQRGKSNRLWFNLCGHYLFGPIGPNHVSTNQWQFDMCREGPTFAPYPFVCYLDSNESKYKKEDMFCSFLLVYTTYI